MPIISLDFSDVQDDPIPAGLYAVSIEQVELKTSRAGDSQYLNWSLQITEGEFSGRKLWATSSLKTKALWALKAQLKALHIDPNTIGSLEVDEGTNLVVDPQLDGLQVIIKVVDDEYQGRKQSRVDSFICLYEPSDPTWELPAGLEVSGLSSVKRRIG